MHYSLEIMPYPNRDRLSDAQLRIELEERAGRAIDAGLWSEVKYRNSITPPVPRGATTDVMLNEIADEIQTLAKYDRLKLPASARRPATATNPETPSTSVSRESSIGFEIATYCELMAREAMHRRDVRAFRARHLHQGLLVRGGIAAWVQSVASTTCSNGSNVASQTDREEQSSERKWRWAKRLRPVLPPWPGRPTRANMHTLEYPMGHSRQVYAVTALHDSPTLMELKVLAVRLMKRYPWSEMDGVALVLSGETPQIPALAITTFRAYPYRILLEADPGLSAEQIASEYRMAQRSIFSSMPQLSDKKSDRLSSKRGKRKALSEKHLKMALLADAKPAESTWQSALSEWNARNSSGANDSSAQYDDVHVFRRDARKALSRIHRNRVRRKARLPGSHREDVYAPGIAD